MNILYIGDVMAEPGMRAVAKVLPHLRKEHAIDIVIAQAENTTEGRGISVADFNRLRKAGVDACTGGNWSLWRDEINDAMSDPAQPIVRPANYPAGTPGKRFKYVDTEQGKVLFVSLLGQVVGRDADKPVDKPLKVIDQILAQEQHVEKAAVIINFHGDFSSEKVIIGHYLDGRATLVVGDHWHVPTADERVLPKGTAHQTDVGMCGILNGSLGVTLEAVIPRWRDGIQTRNQLAADGPLQFNALLVKTRNDSFLAESVQRISCTV